MKKIIVLFAGLAFLTFKNQAQTVTDYDGNVYNTVTIGTQTWMKENLKVTHYRNGIQIPTVAGFVDWTNLTTAAMCYYNNDSAANAPVYGALYNWYAANDANKICPIGWHIPSEVEWNTMEIYLDNTVDTTASGLTGTDIGGKLKETGTTHWVIPNTGATNTSGFNALPGGYRYIYAAYTDISKYGYWWTATENDTADAWDRLLSFDNSLIYRYHHTKKLSGFSIRCICDSTTQINDINQKEKIKMYPNPAYDKVYIDCEEMQDLKMQIYNIIGECVLQRELTTSTNEININLLSKGIYIIKLTRADRTVQRKLIKE